ncbi:hypothetical protein ABPG77_009615 [Micractinium sp. CCAP 211/92]
MKRRGFENLALRLAKRERIGAPPGAVAPQSRRLAENVVPNTPVPGLVPPPNTVIHSFSPCGRYLIAFQPVTSEVVAYRFKGLHMASGAKSAEPTAAPPAHGADQQSPHAAHQQQGTAQSWQRQDGQQEQPQEAQAEGQQGQPVAFGDIFEEHWRCCPCPGRQEQISPEFCAVVHGRHLLLCTLSPERPPPTRAQGAAELVPFVDRTTFHLVELDSGVLLDSHTLRRDFVELGRSQGVHLQGQLLLVLGVSWTPACAWCLLASQTLHVLQVLPTGRFLYLHGIGRHCREDDALVIAQHEAAERRLRQRQGRHGQPPGNASAAAAASAAAGGVAGGGGNVLDAAARPSGHPWPAAAEGAAAAAAAVRRTGSHDSDSGGELSSGQPGAAGAGEPSPLLEGLKQCLLAYLFREAQRQAKAGAAAAAAPWKDADAAACASGGDPPAAAPGGLAGTGGSTSSLLSAAAAGQRRPGGLAGSSGGLVGLGSSSSLASGGTAGGGQQQRQAQAHWRRPLDRFCYYFQAYCELVIWKAQLLDEQRLLVHWCPPEILGGPHHRHGHSASSGAHSTAGSYVMLYNVAEADVERLFVAHSSEFAAWYLSHPAALCGAACGGATDWERCIVPPAASRQAREQQQRDLAHAAKELRLRLADELPVPSQLRQASPYLDPDLYCFDERSIGGPIRPHHPPHRSLKFMCRCQPERLRFRLDPAHLAPPAAAGTGRRAAAAAAAARARHVVYLFHPIQPFLLVVSQDVESGTAEHLAAFTRL